MQTAVPPQATPASTMPVSARTAPHAPAAAQPAHPAQQATPPVRRVPIVPPEPV
jgi:hypothetical protein